MKITPAGAKPTTYTADTGTLSKAASTAREKAISMLTNTPPPPMNTPEDHVQVPTPQIPDKPTEVNVVAQHATTAPAETQAPPQEDKLSTQYAMLARREKQLRAKVQQQQNEIKSREEALKAKALE